VLLLQVPVVPQNVLDVQRHVGQLLDLLSLESERITGVGEDMQGDPQPVRESKVFLVRNVRKAHRRQVKQVLAMQEQLRLGMPILPKSRPKAVSKFTAASTAATCTTTTTTTTTTTATTKPSGSKRK
jgi:hypothetical protein